jgi:hypothetical protein
LRIGAGYIPGWHGCASGECVDGGKGRYAHRRKSGKEALGPLGRRGGGGAAFAEMGAHDEEEIAQFERFAEEEAGLKAHAMELPVVAAGDDDDGGMASTVVAAQDFVQGGTVETGKADIEEDEVRVKCWHVATGYVAVVEESEFPVGKIFEGIAKEFGEFGVVFDDSDAPGGGGIILKRVWL